MHTIDAGQLARGVQILAHGDDGKSRSSLRVADFQSGNSDETRGTSMIIHYNDEKRLGVAMSISKLHIVLLQKDQIRTLVVERVA